MFILTVIVLGVLSVVLTFNIYFTINQIKQERQSNVEQIEKRLKTVLPTPVWTLQYDLIAKILATEGFHEYINAIIIKDIDGTVINAYTKQTQLTDINTQADHIFALKYLNEHIANIYLYYNESILYNAVSKMIKNQFLNALILLISILVLFRVAINKLVVSHLEKLKQSIAAFSQNKNYNDNLHIDSNDEFSYIADEFNTMRLKLQQSWKDLEEINAHLEEIIKHEVEKNRQKEKQLYEQSKFAQMGEMLGNIAHQWRQPLSAISTLASGTKMQIDLNMIANKDITQNLSDIIRQTQFLSQTIEDFRNFLKADKSKEEIDLRDILEKTLFIIGSTLKNHSIQVNLQNTNKPFFIYGYAGEISQVILNILNNAKDALLEREIDDKQIWITLKEETQYIVLEINDNAGGIPLSIMDRIFDPYFTTKHQNVGTGIGLYMSKDIICKHHQGELIVCNNELGALFSIKIPSAN